MSVTPFLAHPAALGEFWWVFILFSSLLFFFASRMTATIIMVAFPLLNASSIFETGVNSGESQCSYACLEAPLLRSPLQRTTTAD